MMVDEATYKESLDQFDEDLIHHMKQLGFHYIVNGERNKFITRGRDVHQTTGVGSGT